MNRRSRESMVLWAFIGTAALFLSLWLPWFQPSSRDFADLLEAIEPGKEHRRILEMLSSLGGQAPINSRVKMGIEWPVPVFQLCAVGAGVLVVLRTSGWFRPPAAWISGFLLLGSAGVAAWCVHAAKAGCRWGYGGFVALAGVLLILAAWGRFHFLLSPRPRETTEK
jgi:hypothetical protein